jgi:rubrerythrin
MMPKKDYKDFMKNYGESQISHNLNAIQHIEKIHNMEYKN